MEKIEKNKTLVRRWFEIEDSGNLTKILPEVDAFFAHDFVVHLASGDIYGSEGFKEYIREAVASWSGDMEHIIEDIFGEGDKVVTRCTFQATHKGKFMGIAPTGKQVMFPVIHMWRIVGGKFQEAWLDWDALFSLMQQLGVNK